VANFEIGQHLEGVDDGGGAAATRGKSPQGNSSANGGRVTSQKFPRFRGPDLVPASQSVGAGWRPGRSNLRRTERRPVRRRAPTLRRREMIGTGAWPGLTIPWTPACRSGGKRRWPFSPGEGRTNVRPTPRYRYSSPVTALMILKFSTW
jgi:hypothetical protein